MNPKKRPREAQRPESRQVVTGLVGSILSPPSPRYQYADSGRSSTMAKTEGSGRGLQNRDKHPNFSKWVEGMIAYVAMVETGFGHRSRLPTTLYLTPDIFPTSIPLRSILAAQWLYESGDSSPSHGWSANKLAIIHLGLLNFSATR